MAKRQVRRPVDFPLVFLTLALLAFGLIMVLSAGAVSGYYSNENIYYYFSQQLKWTFIGLAFACVAIVIPYGFWRRFAGVGIFITVVLLLIVAFTDAGVTAKGSARWIQFGPITIQPSEIAKLTLVLFLAHILDRFPIQHGKDWRIPLGIFFSVLAVVAFLVCKQPDLGTVMVLGLTSVAMLLQTELPLFYFVAAVPPVGGILFYLVSHQDYQWKRILVWLDPWKYASDLGYQITNAEIAFGSGGLLGVGLGRSLQKYGFLPENHTDTIFAIVGEELGLVGTVFLVALFVALYARAYSVTRNCPDRFGRLLGFGLTSSLAIQTAINLAVVTGVLPVTGITLPLISYGGSSLVITLVELGLILNISRYQNVNSSKEKKPSQEESLSN